MALEKVLVVDDDPNICDVLRMHLENEGYSVILAYDGEEALVKFNALKPDIILLDVNLWDMEGFEVLRRLRERGIKTPVIIISGRNEDYDSLYGLSLGADDYVTKPFRPVVLGAKVKALLRRSREFSSAASQQLRCGPFRYDGATMRFFKGEEVLDLSSREGALLLLFLQHPNQVFTKDMLYERVWGTAVAVDDNAIMVYINRLRGKIEPDRQHPVHIRTVRGLGYRFVP